MTKKINIHVLLLLTAVKNIVSLERRLWATTPLILLLPAHYESFFEKKESTNAFCVTFRLLQRSKHIRFTMQRFL